jgi:polyhydroxybutyrate depolymerase
MRRLLIILSGMIGRAGAIRSLVGALIAFFPYPSYTAACGRDSDCVLAGGAVTYRMSPPQGWDGKSPVPVALFFHGWQQTADLVMRDEALVRIFSDIGVLLVAIDGLGKTWTFPGSPSQARDDVATALAILDDVERRFPVDRRLVWATGFSQGGSMVWWLACAAGGRFTAFAPFAGAFWEPMRTDCPGGPANIFHTHGLSDGTVPMTGRTVGGRFRQGDVEKGFDVWRHVNGCTSEAPDTQTSEGEFQCRGWRARCTSGRELRLCLHEGGHELKPAWVRGAWSFVQALSPGRRVPASPTDPSTGAGP